MFTGIIERVGTLARCEDRSGARRWVVDRGHAPADDGPHAPWGGLEVGESIAVDGCCLTLVEHEGTTLSFDIIEESLRCTNLGGRSPGDAVNLERALRIGDRLGGHLVTGHVDGVGTVVEVVKTGGETRLTVEVPPGCPVRVIHKGSITIDGISLTVAATEGSRFTVALIPHTLEITNLSERGVGDTVNLEMDQIGRWVERLLLERGQLPGGVANADPGASTPEETSRGGSS